MPARDVSMSRVCWAAAVAALAVVRAERGGAMRFSILGPLEVSHGGEIVQMGGPRQQIIIATLLLEANRVVPISRLIESVWEDAPPATAREQVQNCLSEIRRRLVRLRPAAPAIETRPPGYLLRTGEGELDYDIMQSRVADARRAAQEARLAEASKSLRSALSLWRGSTLDGLPSRVVRAGAARLDEWRLGLYEQCIEIELQLGRHRELIGELSALTMEFPMREGFRTKLMLALYRAGRQAEALAVYRHSREMYISELGIEPSDNLRQLQQAILRRDPILDPHDSVPVSTPTTASGAKPPCQLPPITVRLIGRQAELAHIRRCIRGGDGGTARPATVVFTGRTGIGKSALAIAAMHDSAEAFPDGVLVVDLQGSHQPISEYEALGRLLSAFNVTAPADLTERAERYRQLINRNKVLLLLDDVPPDAHLEYLLPGAGESAVLITSRHRLPQLASAVRIEVPPLSAQEGSALLAELAGAERVRQDPEATAKVLELCQHLPLAVHVCGLRLGMKPHWRMSKLAALLARPDTRLDELRVGKVSVRNALAEQYRALSVQAQEMFRRIGRLGPTTITASAAGTLCGLSSAAAEPVLEELVDSHLLEAVATTGSDDVGYCLLPLERLFAHELWVADSLDAAEGPIGLRTA